MEFPRLVYKDGGPHPRQGGTYSYQAVQDEQQLEAALDDGWHASLPAAVEAARLAKSDSKPATRDELEQMATKLGVPFRPRVSDKKLREAIDAKLAQ